MPHEVESLEPEAVAPPVKRRRISAALMSLLALFGIIPRWVMVASDNQRRMP